MNKSTCIKRTSVSRMNEEQRRKGERSLKFVNRHFCTLVPPPCPAPPRHTSNFQSIISWLRIVWNMQRMCGILLYRLVGKNQGNYVRAEILIAHRNLQTMVGLTFWIVTLVSGKMMQVFNQVPLFHISSAQEN